jgi:hypothetical protein
MKAKRVTILLGIVAISALTLFLITLMDTEARGQTTAELSAVPDTLWYYEESILIGPDGDSAVEITAVIGIGGSGDLLLPFLFDGGDDFSLLSGPATFVRDAEGVEQPVIRVLGRNMLNLATFETAAAGDTVRVLAHIPDWYTMEESKRPFGEYALKGGYTNFSRFVMRDFRQNLVLPPGMLVHSVTKVFPEYNAKKNPRPPFDFGTRGDKVLAGITAKNLEPAGVVKLELHIRPERRGIIPLVLGLLAAVLYLIFYRDVLKPKETE